VKLKSRIIKRDGEVEIKLSITLSKESVDFANRIEDDGTTIDTIRPGPEVNDPFCRIDRFLCNLRIFAFSCHLWDERECPGAKAAIEAQISRKQYRDSRITHKRRKRR
jgi:hypothetical protein